MNNFSVVSAHWFMGSDGIKVSRPYYANLENRRVDYYNSINTSPYSNDKIHVTLRRGYA